jgi:hypothetical protein
MILSRKQKIVSLVRCAVVCTIISILGASLKSCILAWLAKLPQGGSPASFAYACELNNTMNTAIWVFAIVFLGTLPVALLIDHRLFHSSSKDNGDKGGTD